MLSRVVLSLARERLEETASPGSPNKPSALNPEPNAANIVFPLQKQEIDLTASTHQDYSVEDINPHSCAPPPLKPL